MYRAGSRPSFTKLGPDFLHNSPERIVRPTPILEMPGLKVIGYYSFHDSCTLRWHHHEYHEICFVEEGEVAWEYEGRALLVSGDEISATPPRLIHRGVENFIRPCRLFWLQLDAQLDGLGLRDSERRRLAAALSQAPTKWRSSADRGRVLQDVLLALQEGDDLAARGSFLVFLSMLVRDAAGSDRESRSDSDSAAHIDGAVRYLDLHADSNVSVRDVARRFGFSPGFFPEAFRRRTGLLPKHYILKTRIDLAKARLRDAEQSITRIGLDLGFSSGQHFSNTFRRYTGLTPSEWRRLHREA